MMNTPSERTTQESSPFQWFAEQWAENPFPLFAHRRAGRYNSEGKEALSSNCSPFAGILGVKMSRPQLWDQKQGLDAFSGSWADLGHTVSLFLLAETFVHGNVP